MMHTGRRRRGSQFLFALISLFCFLFSSAFRAEAQPIDPVAFLEILNAKDAELDNANLIFTGTAEKNFEKYPGEFPDPRAAVVPIVHHHQMIVRESATTIIRKLDPSTPARVRAPGGEVRSVSPLYITQCIGGVSKMLSGGGIGDTMSLHIDPTDVECTGLLIGRARMRYCFGVGFGEMLEEISSVVEQNGKYILEGLIRTEDRSGELSPCRLVVDEDYVVRDAWIDRFRFYPSGWRQEIHTAGRFEKEGFVCAKYGSYRVFRIPKGEGDSAEIEDPEDRWDLRCDDIQFHLTQDEYESLTEIVPVGPASVTDRVAGFEYYINENGEVRE